MLSTDISSLGKVLFVGAAFPPSVGGSVVVMRELLKHYDSRSYNIITLRSVGSSGDEELESRTFRIGTRRIRPYRLGLWVRFLQMPFVVNRACRYARECGACVLVCIYPTIDFLFLGCMMAKKTGLPLIVYMHDTLLEAHRRTSFAWVARRLHYALRKRAVLVFAMSEGMQSLYKSKYGLESIVLPHIYSESIVPYISEPVSRALFWGGAIYGINDKALTRVLSAAKSVGIGLTVTGKDPKSIKRQLQEPIASKSVEVRFYETRSEYLEALKNLGVMILALNRPEETEFGYGEISTIFPTKTPEYLASGAPILVHCPKEYYLADFFARYKCGLIVEDPNELVQAIMKLLSNDDEVKAMRLNAKKAAKLFSPEHVCGVFSAAVSKVLEARK